MNTLHSLRSLNDSVRTFPMSGFSELRGKRQTVDSGWQCVDVGWVQVMVTVTYDLWPTYDLPSASLPLPLLGLCLLNCSLITNLPALLLFSLHPPSGSSDSGNNCKELVCFVFFYNMEWNVERNFTVCLIFFLSPKQTVKKSKSFYSWRNCYWIFFFIFFATEFRLKKWFAWAKWRSDKSHEFVS